MAATVTLAGEAFALHPESLRAIAAAGRAGTAPAMLLGCTTCRTVCFGQPPAETACACCRRTVNRKFGAADICGAHVRAPMRETMLTLTKSAA